MKKLALISSYCKTKDKLSVLKKNIIKLKDLGLDILIFTPTVLPKDISELCNHMIVSEENPQFDGHLAFKYHNEIKHTLIYKDYGYASLVQMKRLFEYGSCLDYDIFYQLIYDLDINDTIQKIINDNLNNHFFKSRSHSGRVYDVGCLLSIFDKKHCKLVSDKIDYNRYLNNKMHAEKSYGSIQKDLGIPTYDYITEDVMTNLDYSPFNNSITDDTKIFLDNINMDEGIILIDFYDLTKPLSLEITVNDYVQRFETNSRSFFYCKVDEVKSVNVKVNGVDHNLTNDYTIKTYHIKEVKINENPNKDYIVEYLKGKNIILN